MGHECLEFLFERFRTTGDTGALAEVFDRTAPELLRIARHLTRHRAEADDVLQATFLIAIEKRAAFDGSRRLEAWLFGILARETANARRRASRASDGTRSAIDVDPTATDPSDIVATRELARIVEEALERLPVSYREALRRRFLDGDGRSDGARRKQVHRGLSRLRALLPRGAFVGAAFAFGTRRSLAATRAAVLARAAGSGVAPPAVTTSAAGLVLIGALVLGVALVAIRASWTTRHGEKDDAKMTQTAIAPLNSEATQSDPPARLPVTNPDKPSAAALLRKSPLVRVTVVDEEKHPVKGARVTVLSPDAYDELALSDVAAETDIEGCVTLMLESKQPLFDSVGDVRVLSQREGRATRVDDFRLGHDWKILMDRAATVLGRVLELDTGAPIAGARLVIEPVDPGTHGWRPGGPFEVTSDANGAFEWAHAAPAKTSDVSVFRENRVRWDRNIEVGVSLTQADLLVPSGKAFTALVLDAETRLPIPGVEARTDGGLIATSDSSGLVRGYGFGLGPWTWVKVSLDGYCPDLFFIESKDFDPAKKLVFPMVRDCEVDGSIAEADGRAFAGAEVWSRVPDETTVPDPLPALFPDFDWQGIHVRNESAMPRVRSAADGSFHLRGLKPRSLPIEIYVRAPDGRTSIAGPITLGVAGESRRLDVHFAECGAIDGRVSPRHVGWQVRCHAGSMEAECSIGADGAYRLDGVPAGDVQIAVVDGDDVLASANVGVDTGKSAHYDFDVTDTRREIGGIVVRCNGTPAPHVAIHFNGALGQRVEATTGADGRFRMRVPRAMNDVVPLEYREFPGVAIGPLDAHAGDTGLILVIPQASPTVLRIVDDATDIGLTGWTAHWRMTCGDRSLESDAPFESDGEHNIVLPLGTIHLTVDATPLGYAKQEIDDFEVTEANADEVRTIRLKHAK